MLKHVGRINSTGRRCVVVFRELYNEQGEVIDPDNCLVVETDSLPDMAHQDIIRMVESEPAQRGGDFYNVLSRERMSDGSNALSYLHNSNRLRKFPTNQIVLVPDNNTTLLLSTLNRIIALQKQGKSESEIDLMIRDDTDQAPRKMSNIASDLTEGVTPAPVAQNQPAGVMDDAAIAQSLLKQSETFAAEAERLKKEAYEMDPNLRPRRGRPPNAKSKTSVENTTKKGK